MTTGHAFNDSTVFYGRNGSLQTLAGGCMESGSPCSRTVGLVDEHWGIRWDFNARDCAQSTALECHLDRESDRDGLLVS